MKEDLKSLIQQHLPAMAAGEMKNFIEQAENDKREFEQFKTAHKSATDKLSKLEIELSAIRTEGSKLEAKRHELDEKEKTLNQKEFNLQVAELTYQLQAEKESKNSIFQLVSTFVANPRAIETINKNRTYYHGTDYSPSGGTSHYPTSSFETETRETNEVK